MQFRDIENPQFSDFVNAWRLDGAPQPWVLPANEFEALCAWMGRAPGDHEVVQFYGLVAGADLLVYCAGRQPTAFTPTPGQPYRLEDLEPLRDRLIVAPLAVASRTTGGIHLVETGTQRERPQHGIVLALGPGAWTADKTARVPLQVRVGDCIFYGKYSGQEFELAGQKVLNMGEAEVFTVLRQGRFALVTHEDPKLNHLQGDYCDLCATPAEADAKAALEAERARLVQSRQELEA